MKIKHVFVCFSLFLSFSCSIEETETGSVFEPIPENDAGINDAAQEDSDDVNLFEEPDSGENPDVEDASPEVITCKVGYENCDGIPENGCETNTEIDSKNCGKCNKQCSSNETCIKGNCQ